MGLVAGAAIVATSLVGVANSVNQSRAIKRQGEFESQQLNANARLADLRAEDAIKRGERDAKDHRQRVRTLIGSNRANLAAQGLELDDDSALDVQLNNAEIGAVEEERIKNDAWRESWGYKVTANDFRTNAEFTELGAKNRAKQTLITGGLNAVKDVSSAYYVGSGAGGNKGADASDLS